MRNFLPMLAAAAFALIPILTMPAQAEPPAPGQDPLEWCLLEGGDTIPQPSGSSIAACCTEDGCIICAADWSDCSFDPPYSRPGSSQTRFDAADVLAPPSQTPSGPQLQVPQVLQLR